MTQRTAPSTSPQSIPSATPPFQAPRPALECNLVEGVAAQDAMVALFGEVDEASPDMH